MELRTRALAVLCMDDPGAKAAAAREMGAQPLPVDTQAVLSAPRALPGRPDRPLLVPAMDVPRRSPFTPAGRAALLHAVAHIEFNAIKSGLHIGKISVYGAGVQLHPMVLGKANGRRLEATANYWR
jgi:uncharacterized ferritin-like protein (DUF455 family)